MVKLVATDLDGTLLGDDKAVPEDVFPLIRALADKGVLFVPASGRSPYTLRENFRPVADMIDYVCDNGAVAIASGKTVLSRPVPRETVRDVLEFCKGEEVHVLLCGSRTTYLAPVEGTKYEPHVKPYYFRRVAFDELAFLEDEINKIAICDMRGPRNGSYERLVKMLDGKAAATVSGDIWMDVMQNGVDKGEALRAIQNRYGIGSAETVVFGDYYNDISMLARADYAYVMKNANPDMFDFGNRIAESNNDGGVIKVLRSIADGTFAE